MHLTRVPGLTPEEGARLAEAGVADLPALATAPDLAALRARTGIPEARLATLQAAALDLHEEAGITIQTVAPLQEVAQTLWRAAEDARDELTERIRTAESALRARAADAVHALESRLAALRAALAPKRV